MLPYQFDKEYIDLAYGKRRKNELRFEDFVGKKFPGARVEWFPGNSKENILPSRRICFDNRADYIMFVLAHT
jgi:hypothetical protein